MFQREGLTVDPVSKPRPAVTPQAMVSEIKRELDMRRRVYPRWVSAGKLSQGDADHRIRVLESTLAVISEVYSAELAPPQTTMFAG